MAESMDKVTLLDNMHKGYDELDALLITFTPEQLTTAGVSGTWSIKDILAHLTSWQQRTLDRLDAAARNEEPRTPNVANDEEMNQLNERFYQENSGRDLAEVLANYHAAYQQMVTVVEQAEDEDLFQTGRFSWLGASPLWELVAGNTYEHIQEHSGAIQNWLETTKQAG